MSEEGRNDEKLWYGAMLGEFHPHSPMELEKVCPRAALLTARPQRATIILRPVSADAGHSVNEDLDVASSPPLHL